MYLPIEVPPTSRIVLGLIVASLGWSALKTARLVLYVRAIREAKADLLGLWVMRSSAPEFVEESAPVYQEGLQILRTGYAEEFPILSKIWKL